MAKKDFVGKVTRIGAIDRDGVTSILFTASKAGEQETVSERLGPEVREFEPMAGKTFSDYLLSRFSEIVESKATLADVKKHAPSFIGKTVTITYRSILDEDTGLERSVTNHIWFDGEERESNVDTWAFA